MDIVFICVVLLCCCFNGRDLRVFMSSVGRTLTKGELSKKVTERMELHPLGGTNGWDLKHEWRNHS